MRKTVPTSWDGWEEQHKCVRLTLQSPWRAFRALADTGPHQHCAFIWSESEAPWTWTV